MNTLKVHELDNTHFLVAAQQVFTTTEAAGIREGESKAPAHDAYTRLLKRILPDTEALWWKEAPFFRRDRRVLVVDDTALDKPYDQKMVLVTRIGRGSIGR